MGFEPTITLFRSDILSNWAIRPWVQLALRTNFVQLLQFHVLVSVRFHFSYCLRQLQRLFNRHFVEVITSVAIQTNAFIHKYIKHTYTCTYVKIVTKRRESSSSLNLSSLFANLWNTLKYFTNIYFNNGMIKWFGYFHYLAFSYLSTKH